jgi:UDP-glucuronate 4-epimerase
LNYKRGRQIATDDKHKKEPAGKKTMKRVLITGTAGFIGFHLTRRMLKEGFEVAGLDIINDYYDLRVKYGRLALLGFEKENLQPGKNASSLHSNHTFYRTDLCRYGDLNKVFEEFKPEIVVNLAAQAGVRYSLTNPQAYIDSNIQGFINILECCRHHGVKNLVYASSSSVYGLDKSNPFSVSQHTDHPISLYAASKKSNEMMAHVYSHLFNLPTTGLRFFTVYGPWGRPDMALFLFTKAILENKPIDVYNQGNMLRDFTYVDDIVEGILHTAKKPAEPSPSFDPLLPDPGISSAPYRLYNIGNNSPVRLMDFIEAIEEKLGRRAEKKLLPIQPGDVPETYADVSALERDFGYRPKTSVKEGISRFVDWYREFYNA